MNGQYSHYIINLYRCIANNISLILNIKKIKTKSLENQKDSGDFLH